MKKLDELLCRLLWGQLQSMGWFTEKNVLIADVRNKTGLLNLYNRWLEESIEALKRNGYIRCDGEVCTVISPVPVDIDSVWKEWDQTKKEWLQDPDRKAQILLVEAMLRALPDILTGKVRATDIMFPNSSMELVEGIYKHNRVADFFNEVLADTVVAYVQERIQQDPSVQIRILEIGAGTGGTSAMVLRKLKPHQAHIQEYCYTDISKAFLLHAEKEYGPDNPFLTYRIFNVEKPITDQGVAAGGYDLVVASNVLHATKNIRQTLRNTKAVLKKNGLILLNEINGNPLFFHLTFGLLEGWWLYEDEVLRIPGSPGLYPETWQKVLENEGFQSLFFPAKEAHDLGQQIIVAKSDGVVRQKQKSTSVKNSTKPTFKIGITQKGPSKQKNLSTHTREIRQDLLQEKSVAYIKNLISETLKIPSSKIDSSSLMEEYGLDSILVIQLTNNLSKVLDNISNTLFFEYQTIDALAEHLIKTQRDSMIALTRLENRRKDVEFPNENLTPVKKISTNTGQTIGKPRRFLQLGDQGIYESGLQQPRVHDIAIVGISGRYPGAANIEEFWNILREGRDCITEIPIERWDHSLYFEKDKNKRGKSYCKWGGFIEDVDRFDPLFFNISPREAELMDPQERLFLETVWHLLENSGHTREALQNVYQGMVGVFVGAMYQQYQHFDSDIMTESVLSLSSYSSIANRVSYFFNLQGPSVAIDTACSSSTVAIHMACQNLIRGDCQLAIAGGVNLSIHPKKYIGLSQAQIIGSHLDSRSFGDGDGFLPAEGVGAVLLKPLSRAIQDRDSILAVIKSSAINHGGHSNGYTVPNPNAQAKLMEDNFRQSSIDPRTISYVESAVNGSALGDPIEVNALTKTFKKYTSDKHFCAIGSVKSNIGHAEAASGISQLTKVVLQLQHQELVPTIKTDPLNPNLNFDDTPFYLQKELQKWNRPKLEVNGKVQEFPRRATISSYGAGGANAHLIIEEYIPLQEENNLISYQSSPQVVIFSAKNLERLQVVIKRMLKFVEDQRWFSLSNFAYSLQIGREAMECRLAMVVNNRDELIQGLTAYLDSTGNDLVGETLIPTFTGSLGEDSLDIKNLLSGEAGETIIEAFIAGKHLEKLALYWTKGGKIPWERLHNRDINRKIPLPCYPFERKRCWIPQKFIQPVIESSENWPVVQRINPSLDVDNLNRCIREIISEILGIPIEELPTRKTLNSLGFSSIQAITLRYRLEQYFSVEIPIAAISEDKNIEQLENKLRRIIKPEYTVLPKSELQFDTPNILPVITSNVANRHELFPLNDIQQSFLTGRKLQFGGDWVGCHIYFEIEAKGLDIYRLNKAWERLVDYHEMLRSVILSDGQQKILKKTPSYKFKTVDLRRKNDFERSGYLENIRKNMSHKVYEPGEWPLFEIHISVCPDNSYVIHFSIDELITDASGISMLLKQWKQLYEKPDLKLPDLEVSFRDYVLAVKEFESSNRYRKDMEYWIDKLENIPDGPRLVTLQKLDKTRNKDDYYRIRLKGALRKERWRILKDKARILNVSTTTLLLSIFAEVLRYWSEQETFSLILTYFNRLPLHPQLEQILGPFISTNIFVIEDRQGRNLEEMIRYNQECLWKDLDHSSVSGIGVLRELKARHKISRSLYLPVVFTSLINNLENVGDENFSKHISFMVTQTPQVYLDHQVLENDGNLEFSWDIAKGYFSSDIIHDIFANYCQALHMLSEEDSQWELEILTSEIKSKKEAAATSHKVENLSSDLKLEILPADKLKKFPLTDQQQAYVFGRSVAGGSNSCQIYHEIEVEELDIERLERAWEKLVKTHDMLTAIIQHDGTQKFLKEVPSFKVTVADLTGKTEEEARTELSKTKQLMVEHVFEIGKWPFFDLRISVIDSRKSIIHFSIDMLIADGQSIFLLLHQLSYFYENPAASPVKANLSFRDYILTLQRYKITDGYQRSIQYWENKFIEIPPGPQLPMKSYNLFSSEREQFKGVLENWKILKETAAKLFVKPSIILLTAYMEVFVQWLNNHPFSIVVPCWERLPLHPDINEVVGDFTFMSWVSFRGKKKSFEEKVLCNHRIIREDLSHMAVSGLKALRKITMRRGRKEMLTFPIVFSDMLDHYDIEYWKTFKNIKVVSKTPQVYVDNISEERNGQLYFHWDVAKGIYPEGMIDEMFFGYKRVLETLCNDPEVWKQSDFSWLINARPERYVRTEINDGRTV